MREIGARVGFRWIGVGLAAGLSVLTLGLYFTGRINLYINPDGAWFAVVMAVIAVIGAIASFALPLGAEADHGHDHGHGHAGAPAHDHASEVAPGPRRSAAQTATVVHGAVGMSQSAASPAAPQTRAEARAARAAADALEADAVRHESALTDRERDPVTEGEPTVTAVEGEREHREGAFGITAAVVGGVLATAVVGAALVLPPAALSTEAAMARALGSAPLFGGADVLKLATTGDLTSFRIGEWSTVFRATPDPTAYDGAPVTLTGYVAPGSRGQIELSRLVITHCVIDAQPASVPVDVSVTPSPGSVGQWVTVKGTVKVTSGGGLIVEPETITAVKEPADPYEF